MFIVEQQNNKPAKKEIIRPENEKTSKADACRKTSRLLCLILCKNVDSLIKWKKKSLKNSLIGPINSWTSYNGQANDTRWMLFIFFNRLLSKEDWQWFFSQRNELETMFSL